MRCGGCGAKLRVPDEYANRQAKCPSCAHVQRVPPLPSEVETHVPTELAPNTEPATEATPPLRSSDSQRSDAFHSTFGETGSIQQDSPRTPTAGEISRPPSDSGVSANARLAADAARATDVRQLGTVAQAVAASSGRSSATSRNGRRHRGVIVLTLAILGLLCTCPLFSIPAWVIGSKELQLMNSGEVDSAGRDITRIGYYLGMGASLLWITVSFCVTLTLLITSGS